MDAKKERTLWDYFLIGTTLLGAVGVILFGIGGSDLMTMTGLLFLVTWAVIAFLNGLVMVWVWIREIFT